MFPGQTTLLEVSLQAISMFTVITDSGGDQITDTEDFGHTAKLLSLQFFDENMNPIAPVHILSASGFDYLGNQAVNIPEPGTFILFCVAFLGFCFRLSIKSHQW